mmetsp:Transcript_52604/g.47219  ORF Transcript_52604/g.47219 Transcript_52604/m.47219 type:complete len:107 (-) Transcript_52604:27-347(-)
MIFFIVTLLLALSVSGGDVRLSRKAIKSTNSTVLSERVNSICVKSFLDDGSIAVCEDDPLFACPLCANICIDNGFSYLCCDGDTCCCYNEPVPCDTNPSCLTNSCA